VGSGAAPPGLSALGAHHSGDPSHGGVAARAAVGRKRASALFVFLGGGVVLGSGVPTDEQHAREAVARLPGGPEALAILEETLTPRGARQWCYAANRILQGQRPVDCLTAGEREAVLQAARAYVDGDYV
jgi:hypothetical protein